MRTTLRVELLERTTSEGKVRVSSEAVRIGGRQVKPAHFEASFGARSRSRGNVRVAGVVRVMCWCPGFGCHVAHCRVGDPDARHVEFRYVRTGPSEGFFDLAGVAAPAVEAAC